MKISSETSKILSEEHENILTVVSALELEAGQLKDKQIDTAFFTNVLDFIINYADRFHHAKEEDILFKEFNKCAEEGYVHCNPVGQMLSEHNEGRKYVRAMEAGLNEKNKNRLSEGARGYIQLIREHIFKEDNILYPMADDVLSDKVQKAMLEKFKKINTANQEEIKRFERFAKEVARR